MATPDPPDEPLAPLPSWQLFASVSTQSELLDAIALGPVDQVAEPATRVEATPQPPRDLIPGPVLDPLATSAFAVATPGPDPAQVAEGAPGWTNREGQASPAAPAPSVPATGPAPTFTAAAAPTAQAVQSPLVDLGRTIRRSIFLPPLPGLGDVASGVEPATRTIAPVGSDYVPGSIGRAIIG